MPAAKIRKILCKLAAAAAAAFAVLVLLMFAFVFLMEQGWQRPVQSLCARGEMRSYLEEAYAGRRLRIGFPVYNMIMDEFCTIIKDGDGQALFGLVYREDNGVVERAIVQGRDGNYYLSGE